jgi:hypothetical protein
MTTLSTFYRYKFDPTGISPTNTVLGERIVISTPKPIPIPLHEGMFYNSSSYEPKLILSDVGTGETLVEGTDYTLIGMDHLIYARTGVEAYAAFMLTDKNYTGTLSATYNCVGGPEGIATSFVKELIETVAAAGNGAKLDWADIQNKPSTFPVMDHEQPLASLTGFESFSDSLQRLADTLVARVPLGGSASGMSETLDRLTKMQAEIYNALTEFSMLSAGLVEYDDLIGRINQINLDIEEVIAKEAFDVETILDLIADIRASLSSDVEGNITFLEGIDERIEEIIATAALEKTTTADARTALSLRINTTNDLFTAEKIATSTARAALAKTISDNLTLFSAEKIATAAARTALAKSISDNYTLFTTEKAATLAARNSIAATVTTNLSSFNAEKVFTASERSALNSKIANNTIAINNEVTLSANERKALGLRIDSANSTFNSEKISNKSDHDLFTETLESIMDDITGMSSVYLGINDTAANSGKLSGQAASYYLSASNLNSGTLPSARLPSTIAAATTGNAATATKLSAARNIALTGDASGSANFDGSSNVSISVVVADDSHTHDGRYYTEAEANIRFLLADALKGYADTGRHLSFAGDLDTILTNSTYNFTSSSTTNHPTGINSWGFVATMVHSGGTTYATQLCYSMNSGNGKVYMRTRGANTWSSWKSIGGGSEVKITGDVTGNGVTDDDGIIAITATVNDSSLLDGQNAAYYRNASNINSGTIASARLPSTIAAATTGNAATATKLATARTISLSGDVTGSTTFDGSGNVVFATTVGDSSKLNGQLASYYLSASNLSSGTLPSARLPTTIAASTTGNAATATKLATARTITLAGNATGSASFDGSANVSLTVTVAEAAKLGGQDSAYYRNAGNLNAGTIASARLPSTIAASTTGNAATATKLATARRVTFEGQAYGDFTFDGSANLTCNINVVDSDKLDGQDASFYMSANDAPKLDGLKTVGATERYTGDLNDIATNSQYSFVNSPTSNNGPEGFTGWGIVETKCPAAASSVNRVQQVIPLVGSTYSGCIWQRMKYSGTSWTEWSLVGTKKLYVPLFVPASAYGSGAITLSEPLDNYRMVMVMLSNDSNRALSTYFIDPYAIHNQDTANSITFIIGGYGALSWHLYIDDIGLTTMRTYDQNCAVVGIYGVV